MRQHVVLWRMHELEMFNTRLMLAVHGIPAAELDRSRINDIVTELARVELRTLVTLAQDAATFDEAAEELRAVRKMTLRRVANRPDVVATLTRVQGEALAEIEDVKRDRDLRTTDSPDVSRATPSRWESASIRTPGSGIEVRDLWRDGERRALHVTIPAGAQWPAIDYHVPGPEEVFVLSGDLNDGPVVHTAGTFIHYPAGSSHRPSSRAGCSLFVFYPEG